MISARLIGNILYNTKHKQARFGEFLKPSRRRVTSNEMFMTTIKMNRKLKSEKMFHLMKSFHQMSDTSIISQQASERHTRRHLTVIFIQSCLR